MKTLTKLSFLPLILFLLNSCSSSDDGLTTYYELQNLTGNYTQGVRTTIRSGSVIIEQEKPYNVRINNSSTNTNQLNVILNYDSQENLDIFDVTLTFYNFKWKNGSNKVQFNIKDPIIQSNVREEQIPDYLKEHFEESMQLTLVEIRNLRLEHSIGYYDSMRDEITFESTGRCSPYFSDGSSIINMQLSIVYTLRK